MALKSLKTIFPPALVAKKIILKVGSSEIELQQPSKPKLTASSVLNSLNIQEFKEEVGDINFNIMYYSYIDRLEVIVNCSADVDLEVVSQNEEAIESKMNKIEASLFDTYVPVVGYTQKTKNSILLMKSYANKNIMPLLVVGSDNRFDKYLSDNFIDNHFLDLSLLHLTTNQLQRDEVALFNQGKKREDKQKMPPREYAKIESWDDIKHFYNRLVDKSEHVIPTIRISLSQSASMMYAKAVSSLSKDFNKLALRINPNQRDMKHLKSYLLPLASDLENVFIILEVANGQDIKLTHEEISAIETLSGEVSIMLLSENINARDEIIKDNIDIYAENQALVKFKNLQNYHGDLIYADYCGFEKDTSVEPTGYPARTAKIFYINFHNLDQFYIRRERDPSNSWVNAMENLQSHINASCPKEINIEHCEACKDILTKTTNFSLGDMKENCIIHNGISIAMA